MVWHNDAFDAHAHLFDASELRAAGVDQPVDHADEPVDSLCRATASYGPFYPTGYARSVEDLQTADDVCQRCLSRWQQRIDDADADSDDAHTDGGTDTEHTPAPN